MGPTKLRREKDNLTVQIVLEKKNNKNQCFLNRLVLFDIS